MRYELIIYWSKADQSFVVEVPELPGCMADGASYEEAVVNAQAVIAEWIETARSLGRAIPEPHGKIAISKRPLTKAPQPTVAGRKEIYVERRDEGDYAVRRPGSERASAVTPTQRQAIERAREIAPDATIHVERVRRTSEGKPDKWRKSDA